MGIWMEIPLPEEDQVVPRSPKSDEHYNPWILVSPLPISQEKSFKEEELQEDEPFEEEGPLEGEESPEGVNDEVPTDSSQYLESPSSEEPADHVETKVQVEDDTTIKSDSQPLHPVEVLLSPPSPSHQLVSLRVIGPLPRNTPRRSISIPSQKRAASHPLSPRASKRPCRTHRWNPQIYEWIDKDKSYEVGDSSQAPLQHPIPQSPDRSGDICIGSTSNPIYKQDASYGEGSLVIKEGC